MGDKVLTVNGKSLVGTDHWTAVEALKAAGGTLDLYVAREVTRIVAKVVKICSTVINGSFCFVL